MRSADRSPVWRNALTALVLVAVVLLRGSFLAHQLGGTYRVASFLTDVVLLLGLVAMLRLLDAALRRISAMLVRGDRRRQQVLRATLHGGLGIVIAAPLIVAAVQLHPQKIGNLFTPATLDLPFEAVTLDSDGTRLDAWYIPGRADAAQVVLAHGLAANKANFLAAVDLLHAAGFGCLAFDFHGHGDSDGLSTTFGYREAADVKAAHDWLRRLHGDRPIHALGYSMGAAAILRAARQYDLFDRIVVDSTFAALESVARHSVLKPLGPLARPLFAASCAWTRLLVGVDLRRHRPLDDVLGMRDRPLLIIHGTADRMIPIGEGRRLHDAAPWSQWWAVPGADHAATLQHRDYASRVAGFLRGVE